jgi:DUF177 domain-containing protein
MPMERVPAAAPGSGKFDAARLIRDHGTLEGQLDARALPRVADQLMDGDAPIDWRITGISDGVGRPALAIDLEGELPLECQRCLGVYRWPLRQRTEVLVAHDDAEMARLDNDSELEVVLATGPLDPAELVEDELVLAIPFAPLHPQCPTHA